MLIAIDHGNYAIKTPHHSFVSGLSEHTVKPPMSDEILEYDGRYWTTSGKRLSYMRDKTQDDRYFILTLFAIAKELEDTGRYSLIEREGRTAEAVRPFRFAKNLRIGPAVWLRLFAFSIMLP